jgi:hypothetical protein
MDTTKMERVRQLFSANRTFGEIERDERMPLHHVTWCAWLRWEPIESAVRLFATMALTVPEPYGKNGLAWLRSQGVAIAGEA